MDPRMIELLNKNFDVNTFGDGEKYWTLDEYTVAAESGEKDENKSLMVFFEIDKEESMNEKHIKTLSYPLKINGDRLDILEKELDGFLTDIKKIRKLFRKSMIEDL